MYMYMYANINMYIYIYIYIHIYDEWKRQAHTETASSTKVEYS
jgi:hypothetical protein